MEKTIVSSISDWQPIIIDILASVTDKSAATVLALSGDLGAGKTTFVQQVAKVLGVTEPITSPTFNLLKRYETTDSDFKTLFHMDVYRLESEDELVPLRFADLLTLSHTLICIEWAEKIRTALPPNTQFYHLAVDRSQHHTIQKVS